MKPTYALNAFILSAALLVVGTNVLLAQETAPPITPEPSWTAPFYEGDLAGARQQLLQRLQSNPDDAQARFGLAAARLFIGVESLMQAGYRHGFRPDGTLGGFVPFARLPIPLNPEAGAVAYDDVRIALKAWLSDLERTAAELDRIDAGPVKLPLHIGKVRLDFDGDGQATENEALWRVYAMAMAMGMPRAGGAEMAAAAEDFRIVFDKADVHWLRGYTHLLMGLTEMALAHDWRELFERTAHLFFVNPDTPFTFLTEQVETHGWNSPRFLDAIAWIHLLDLDAVEPDRMASAREHFLGVLRESRLSWQAIRAETDDEREWIPAPDQTGVIPGVAVSEDMVVEWHRFLDEAEALLNGDKLIPFWRPAGGRGVNLKRVFTEPTGFDLVLWVQGTAAAPYLEQGEVTDAQTWREIRQTFRGRFLGFAAWFN